MSARVVLLTSGQLGFRAQSTSDCPAQILPETPQLRVKVSEETEVKGEEREGEKEGRK